MIGTSISESPVIAGVAAADINKGAGKFVKFDANGQFVVCSTAGEAVVGLIILQTNEDVKAGDSITVQTCCKGMAIAGGAVNAGDMLSVDANGCAVKATAGTAEAAGAYIIGQALEKGAAGAIIKIEVIKGGRA